MPKKIAKITDFAQGGVNTELGPWTLPNNTISDGNNFRINGNSIHNFGGTELWATTPNEQKPGYLMSVRQEYGSKWLTCGNKVQAYDGNNWADISRLHYSGNPKDWTGCMMGNIPIVLPPSGSPEYWSPQSMTQKLKSLIWTHTDDGLGNVESQTWEEKGYACRIIRSHKDQMIALDIQDPSEGSMPHGVLWSDPADSEDIPYSWDFADPTTRAGLNVLGGDGGRIIDGLSMRDNFCVYREGSVWMMNYVGGQWVWRFNKLSFTIGALTNNCIAEFLGRHVILGDGDIVVNDGQTIKSIVHNRMRTRINSTIDSNSYKNSFVTVHKAKKEVWICIPERGENYATKAYIWNWEEDTWSIRDIPDLVHGSFGTQTNKPLTEEGEEWNGATIVPKSWDSMGKNFWNTREFIPFDDTIMGLDKDAKLITLDPTAFSADTIVETLIERTDMPIDSQQKVVAVDRIYPNAKGSGEFLISIGGQQQAGGPVYWQQPKLFRPGTDRKIDTRVTGALIAVRITSDTAAKFSLTGIDFEYALAGER